jgi:hypothetical protein
MEAYLRKGLIIDYLNNKKQGETTEQREQEIKPAEVSSKYLVYCLLKFLLPHNLFEMCQSFQKTDVF